MIEADVIHHLRAHLETQFPKACAHCHRTFAHLHDYLLHTKHLGPVMPYDVEAGDWRPTNPLGIMTYANCECGNTLVLSSKGMPLPLLWQLLLWARIETLKRGITATALLTELRERMSREILSKHHPHSAAPAAPPLKIEKPEPAP